MVDWIKECFQVKFACNSIAKNKNENHGNQALHLFEDFFFILNKPQGNFILYSSALCLFQTSAG